MGRRDTDPTAWMTGLSSEELPENAIALALGELRRHLSTPRTVSIVILVLMSCSPSNPTAPPTFPESPSPIPAPTPGPPPATPAPALKPLWWAEPPPIRLRLEVGESFTSGARLSKEVEAVVTVTPSSDAIKAEHRVLGPGSYEFTITGEKLGSADLTFTAKAPGYQTAEITYEAISVSPPPAPPLGAPANIRVVDRGQDFLVWEWDPVEGATAYLADAGYPRGTYPRGTPPEQEPPAVWVEEPSFRVDGLDPGIGYYLLVRAARETAGQLELGPWSSSAGRARTIPPQETRSIERGPLPSCVDQQQMARQYNSHPSFPNPVTHAWDTTPFRVYFEPEFSDEAREQVARFAWKLEYRLGYPILDAEVVDDLSKADIQVRFNQAVMDRGSRAWANSQLDPPAVEVSPEGADDEDNRRAMIEHEVSHLFGFEHNQTCSNGRGVGVEMSPSLSCYFDGERTGRGAAEEDIDNIGCVFPHPNFPR